jgi:hypothetical protein
MVRLTNMRRTIHWMAAMAAAVLFASTLLSGASASQPVIPSGSQIDVKLTTTVSSSANQQGDPFLAEVEQPIFAGGQEIIHAGSTLRGHVAFVKPPGRAKGKAEMRLVADSIITKDGKQYVFTGQLAGLTSDNGVKMNGKEGTLQGPGKSKKTAAKDSGIGAAVGAGVGALGDGGTGALYGAGIGAVAMAIRSLAKHHKDVVLEAGTDLTFVLTSPATESRGSKSAGADAPFVCAGCK